MQFLPFGGLCQFLIGNVKHLGLDAERKAEKCQFLIGNVKHTAITAASLAVGYVCQFLIGNVKLPDHRRKKRK